MGLLFLFYFFEIYAVVVLGYVVYLLVRDRRIPWWLLVAEMICIGVFIYFSRSMESGRYLFIDKPEDASESWGKGLGNVFTYVYSKGMLILLFFFTQLIFWICFMQALWRKNN